MRAALIYFTGTGNSKRTLDYAKENLPFECDVYNVMEDKMLNPNDYEHIFIFYPIYGFNAPKPIIDFVKKINKSDKQINCVIMKNSGEHLFWNNGSSLYLASCLKRKNIIVRSEYHYLMPYSFIFRHTDYMAYRMDTVAKGLIKLDIKDYLDNKYVPIKRFFLDRAFAFILRIQWWGGRFNGRFYKIDMNKCIKCMKCVKDCPIHNIKFENDKFKFGGQCLMCQRCVQNCPKDAFKSLGFFTSWKVNPRYTFIEVSEYQKEKKPNYCKKNYQKYFAVSEARIKENA